MEGKVSSFPLEIHHCEELLKVEKMARKQHINAWVLFSSFDKKHITVRLLEHDRNDDKESVLVTRSVDRVVKHKNYNAATFNNDIALLRLDREVKMGKDVNDPAPVCLPPAGKPISDYCTQTSNTKHLSIFSKIPTTQFREYFNINVGDTCATQ